MIYGIQKTSSFESTKKAKNAFRLFKSYQTPCQRHYARRLYNTRFMPFRQIDLFAVKEQGQ